MGLTEHPGIAPSPNPIQTHQGLSLWCQFLFLAIAVGTMLISSNPLGLQQLDLHRNCQQRALDVNAHEHPYWPLQGAPLSLLVQHAAGLALGNGALHHVDLIFHTRLDSVSHWLQNRNTPSN